jgi:RNA polymerase sigma factor (TIGR02999 family)
MTVIDPDDSPSGEVTRLLSALHAGNPLAREQLLQLVYRELRRLAAGMLRRERRNHTLQPTALVHEAYLKLIGPTTLTAQNRGEFFAIAARSMRQILVDHARRNLADKRGGAARQRIELQDCLVISPGQSLDILALNEALDKLKDLDERQCRMVEMQYFAGHTVEEIAEVFHTGPRTVKRNLQTARLFLRRQLETQGFRLL